MYEYSSLNLKGRVRMQTYEFYAQPKDGAIPIPERYRELITDSVMVIVIEKKPEVFEGRTGDARKKTDALSPPTLKTKGWKFNREEANAR